MAPGDKEDENPDGRAGEEKHDPVEGALRVLNVVIERPHGEKAGGDGEKRRHDIADPMFQRGILYKRAARRDARPPELSADSGVRLHELQTHDELGRFKLGILERALSGRGLRGRLGRGARMNNIGIAPLFDELL